MFHVFLKTNVLIVLIAVFLIQRNVNARIIIMMFLMYYNANNAQIDALNAKLIRIGVLVVISSLIEFLLIINVYVRRVGIVSFRVIRIQYVCNVIISAKDARVEINVQAVQLKPKEYMMLSLNYAYVEMGSMMIQQMKIAFHVLLIVRHVLTH